MLNRESANNIWVVPGATGGDGSSDMPYGTVQEAVDAARPGETVLLTSGTYGSLTVQEKCGEKENPITITVDEEADVLVTGEWYFYGCSDFIVSGMAFKGTSGSALSMVGASERNVFKHIVIENCGAASNCMLFVGGSGCKENLFERITMSADEKSADMIGMMLSQSVDTEDTSIPVSKHQVVRYCSFAKFGTAVLAGSGDDIEDYGYPKVEDSHFVGCDEGVRIKAHGTMVKGALFEHCAAGVVHIEGVDTDITENRFNSCEYSVVALLGDITVHENCMVDAPIKVEVELCALPVIVHNNSFIFTEKSPVVHATGEGDFYALFSDNLFSNVGIILVVPSSGGADFCGL